MSEYEKSPRRRNYYQNNGFDNEQWDFESNYPPAQNGYLNHQWNDDNGYHDTHHYDRRHHDDFEDRHHRLEEERFHDDKEEDHGVDERQERSEEFEPPSKAASEWDDKFEEFKNGPFPKKYIFKNSY